jgi:hypothetical protein
MSKEDELLQITGILNEIKMLINIENQSCYFLELHIYIL